MTVTFVRHRVADYDAWRRVYDSVADMQRAGGVTAQAVYRLADDPNTVAVMHRFESADAARAFFDDPEVRAAVAGSGVDMDSLRMEIYEEA